MLALSLAPPLAPFLDSSRAALLAALLFATIATPAVAADDPEGLRLVDRVVAVVDEDPILLSDIERAIGLGLVAAVEGESDDARRRRALDALIEQRLRLHEVARFGFEAAPLDEVERQLEELHRRFADEAAFHAELERLDLDEAGVRALVARQLSILAHVEERLGPRVFVGIEEIRKHYDEELVPALAAAGQPAPPIEEVREQIRAVLRERRLDEEIVRWTEELRRKADVVDLLDTPDRPLPPEIVRLPSESPP